MTLRDRIAQLVIGVAYGDVYSTESDDYKKYHHWITDSHIGGLIVINEVEFGSARNANPFAMAVFLNQMQRLSKLPLLVGGDFERAASMRVTGGTQFPHSMAFGAANDLTASRYEGLITAREARALGVHWVFAPVADVNNNPRNPVINIRSYGEDPDLVSQHVAAFIQGAHQDPAANVLVTAKHFPGHGDTDVDSHIGLPTLNIPRYRMDATELKPFRVAIANHVDSIMTAHMAVPELDASGVPATVSPKVLTDLLRNEMKFEGLIVTDAMNMQGLSEMFSTGEASVRSILAGADVLLMPPDPDLAIRAVASAVENGRIPKQRINESAVRVLAAKIRLGLLKKRLVNVDEIADTLASPEAAARAQEIADHGVTLLRNENNVVPLAPASRSCLVLINSLRDVTARPTPGPRVSPPRDQRTSVHRRYHHAFACPRSRDGSGQGLQRDRRSILRRHHRQDRRRESVPRKIDPGQSAGDHRDLQRSLYGQRFPESRRVFDALQFRALRRSRRRESSLR
ncbi:MAG: glycoside hydrolase family 3 N-terminal domain-containing protein [Acidobacteriota bacterium]